VFKGVAVRAIAFRLPGTEFARANPRTRHFVLTVLTLSTAPGLRKVVEDYRIADENIMYVRSKET
jgi:hypothetical protein